MANSPAGLDPVSDQHSSWRLRRQGTLRGGSPPDGDGSALLTDTQPPSPFLLSGLESNLRLRPSSRGSASHSARPLPNFPRSIALRTLPAPPVGRAILPSGLLPGSQRAQSSSRAWDTGVGDDLGIGDFEVLSPGPPQA